MNKDQVDYDREIDEWRYQVGHALLSFVDIEFFTLRCLDLIPSDKISKASFRRPFTERMDLLIEIIKDRCNTPSSAAAHLIDKLKVAKKLAETRNLIAHSPLQLKVPTWATAADRVISDARSPDRLIDLASLKEFAAATEDLVSELYLALDPVIGQINGLVTLTRRAS